MISVKLKQHWSVHLLSVFSVVVCWYFGPSLLAGAVVSLQLGSGSGVGLYDGVVQIETKQRPHVAAFRRSDRLRKEGQCNRWIAVDLVSVSIKYNFPGYVCIFFVFF